MSLTQQSPKKIYIRVDNWLPFEPTSDTIAYFPLQNDLDDYSWNNKSLTAPIITKHGVGYRATWWVTLSSNSSTAKTMSFWFYIVSGNSPFMSLWWPWTVGAGYYYEHNEARLKQHLFCWTDSSWGASTVPLSIWAWAWHHIVFTYDSSWPNVYGYVDGTQYLIYNWVPYSFDTSVWFMGSQANSWQDGFSGNFMCDLSELIVESKYWTQQNVTDYYNATKWIYWIS